jgi:hypothetical protein
MCRGPPEPGELVGLDSSPYSHSYFEVRLMVFSSVPST